LKLSHLGNIDARPQFSFDYCIDGRFGATLDYRT